MRQRQFITTLMIILLAVSLLLAGCRSGGKTGDQDSAENTIKDDSGVLVSFRQNPQRIISLAPNNTEILFALGLGDRVVGVTTYCNYPPEAGQKPKVGDLQGNLEQVVAMKPDLVVAKWSLNKDAVANLRKLNIPVLCVEPESIDGVYRAIRMVAQATGTGEVGEKIVSEMKSGLDRVQGRLAQVPPSQRSKVFIEIGDQPLYTTGAQTFVDEVVRLGGGLNIAADIQGYQMYGMETVVEKNPDVILALDSYYVDVDKVIKKRPGWEGIKAVREGRIIGQLDLDMINRPGPRSAEAVEKIAQALYPEIFKDQ